MDFQAAINKRYDDFGYVQSLISTMSSYSDKLTLEGNSAKKKYCPERHEVIDYRKSSSDFIKESAAMGMLSVFNNKIKFLNDNATYKILNDAINIFFSFQKKLDVKQENQIASNVMYDYKVNSFQHIRKVSGYDKPTQLLQYRSGYKLVKDLTWHRDNNHIERVKYCIHQIMFCHFVLFIKRIMHGDMHMNNIKWIPYEDSAKKLWIAIKIFDFGNSKFDCSGGAFWKGDRYNDLEYLFQKKSQKSNFIGWVEGVKRNIFLPDNGDQLKKHYPLHYLLGCADIFKASEKLEPIGTTLMCSLKNLHGKKAQNTSTTEAVLSYFTNASNRICKMIQT